MWRAQTSRKGRHILNAVRLYAAEPTPLLMPKPTPKSNAIRVLKYFGLGLPVVVSGVVGYAWFDHNFRIQVLYSIPYAKDLLGSILPESDETIPATSIQIPGESTSLEKAPVLNVEDLANDASFRKMSNEIDPEHLSSQSKSMKPIDGFTVSELIQMQDRLGSEITLIDDLLIKDSAIPRNRDKIDSSVVETQLQRRVENEKADNAALETVIQKLLANGPSLVEEAVKAQSEAAASIRKHTQVLKQAMDDNTADNIVKDVLWEAVADANREKEQAILKASDKLSESKKCVEKLQDVIQEGKTNRVTQNNPAITEASNQLGEFLRDLGSVTLQIRQAETEANMIQKYKDLVDKGRKLFQKELESLVPALKPGADVKLSEDELNILIAHSYRRIEQLQEHITHLQTVEEQKLITAHDTQRQEDLKITNASIADERKHLHEEFDAEKSKLQKDYSEKLETEVRKHLTRQTAAHNDHLKDVLAVQKTELTAKYYRTLQFRILEEKEKFQAEVAGWISKLHGIEAAVDARAANEKLTRSAQNLWLACVSLNSVINFGGDSENKEQLQPLRRNVETVVQAGGKNAFVEKLTNSFSDTALDRGVSTEEQLKSRFYKVSRVCHRLGLVNTLNASLYKYLISYLHSLVVFENVVATSETEEVDLNSLDTFGLLARARYWMDKGNLDLAVRFMIQLSGESRRAASDWINEAKLFLETKQTASTLAAYASASGLANTF